MSRSTAVQFRYNKLLLRPECQQHISRHATVPGISRVDEQHSSGDYWPGSVQRAAFAAHSIDGLVVSRRVDVPKHAPVFGGEGAKMSVYRSGKHYARYGRD